MGLDTASTKFICAAKSLGVDFSNLLMVGRQSLFPEKHALQRIFAIHGIDVDAAKFLEANKYAEKFFSLLGAREIHSLDYSSYENATIIHDMNSPIPERLKEKFSVVYDGGTIEHVFNIPQALKNCMEMVSIGGHFLQANIANNFMGHGFWQFSPELLFRVFSPENGFKTELVLLHEVVSGGAWVVVSDPNHVRQRVELCNSRPTYILTIARRISNVEVFARPPLQSDYSALWDQSARDQAAGRSGPAPGGRPRFRLRHYLPEAVKRPLRAIHRKLPGYSLRPLARPYYRFIPEERLLRGKVESGG